MSKKINPFTSSYSSEYSNYFAPSQGEEASLVEARGGTKKAPAQAQTIHRMFHDFVEGSAYPCLGAKASFRGGNYRFGVYSELASDAATAGLAYDLYDFSQEQSGSDSSGFRKFSSFVACFQQTALENDQAFEALLWEQLHKLHHLDRQFHRWDAEFSSDPKDRDFSFSFAERAYFVVGLSPVSVRRARNFAFPTLVFNAHFQFERLRSLGQYDSMRDKIRKRDIEFHGNVNPILQDFGDSSEAPQYASREPDPNWACPVHKFGSMVDD